MQPPGLGETSRNSGVLRLIATCAAHTVNGCQRPLPGRNLHSLEHFAFARRTWANTASTGAKQSSLFYIPIGITYNTAMEHPSIVMDTSVWIAALGSRLGASFRLLEGIDSRRFVLNVSVPLILEYESVAKREAKRLGLTTGDIDDLIDYICAVAKHWQISYLWRPTLSDPGDEMILELAVTARSSAIITFNEKDFSAASQFGIRILRPGVFLKEIGDLP